VSTLEEEGRLADLTCWFSTFVRASLGRIERNRIESKRMTWLEYNEALQELHPDSEVVVGTGAQATWRLRRADLMPRHFVVSTSDGGAGIRPFSSDTVVTVNGRQIPTGISELRDGDVIEAGSAEFRFWAATPGDSRIGTKAPVTAHLIDARRRSALSLHRVSTGIGRDESNVLVIDDDSAASFHAEVRREAGGHALHGCDSALVKVNGHAVSAPVMLNEGDEVQIATLVLRYTRGALPEGIDAAPMASLTSSAADLELIAPHARSVRPPSMTELSSAVTLRTPMRAVAFVSSVIAAVAIATLVFLHR